jgi:hypothetical protein
MLAILITLEWYVKLSASGSIGLPE